MSKFKKYLGEEPLPPEFSTTFKKGDEFKKSMGYKGLEKRMKDAGYKALGAGSSRIGFRAKQPVDVFFPEDKERFKLGEGETNTVIKLAKNAKGIFQNTVEVEMWMNIERSTHERFLCPILDWSGNPRYGNDNQYTLDFSTFSVAVNADYNGVIWLQMPEAIPADKDSRRFKNLLEEYFGPPGNSWGLFGDFQVGDYQLNADRKERKGANEDQLANYVDFMDMLEHYEIGDISQSANWGIYDDRPVLLDYGFHTKTTQQIYWGDANFKVYVNPQGEVKIYYREKKKR